MSVDNEWLRHSSGVCLAVALGLFIIPLFGSGSTAREETRTADMDPAAATQPETALARASRVQTGLEPTTLEPTSIVTELLQMKRPERAPVLRDPARATPWTPARPGDCERESSADAEEAAWRAKRILHGDG